MGYVKQESEGYAIVKRLQPIGGSLALLLPSYASQKMNFNRYTIVRIIVQDKRLIIENAE